jgi:two-component system NtrC family sensor kinase
MTVEPAEPETRPRPTRSAASVATRLTLSYLLVIAIIGVVFLVVGVWLIGNRIVTEAQEKVAFDLNSAREIYLGRLRHINDVIKLTADRKLLIDSFLAGQTTNAGSELDTVRRREGLDVLTVTDTKGVVILRTSNPSQVGDDQSHDELVAQVFRTGQPVAATVIVQAKDLALESPALAEQAYFRFIDTPMARPRPETEETAGMMLKAAAPVLNEQGELIGVIYGGTLLNRNYEIVDTVKQTVYQNLQYRGSDIGTATIFQDDVRISTNVRNKDGSRAIGTRVAEDVYNRVVREGQPWIGRAYVVNNWYITAYEPIRDSESRIIGILYVGILEQKYVDLRRDMALVFVGITLLGILTAMGLSYFVVRRISIPIRELASASRNLARGNLDTRVSVDSHDELGELAEAFNLMAASIQERDTQIKEMATRKLMESERLVLIGQLSANIAHELNNPLQGIVTYAHLALERLPADSPLRDLAQKTAVQANRCREIIRGLLDFARQRKPSKTVTDINAILRQCISLVQGQALFLNVQISERLQPDLPKAVVDPSLIERVFVNMIVNAAEAMPAGGRLTLTTSYAPPDSTIEIAFTDTGNGIPPENLEKIFDPFFTTKEVGTGLGLAISYGIVKEHHGTIAVESKVGQGTTFTIRLPVLEADEG